MAKKINRMETRLQELADYLSGVEIKGNLYIMKVVYPDKWGAFPSEDGLISAARGETAENLWFYYANIGEVDLDDMFDLIDETIKENESAIKKIEVYKEKMYELKALFDDRSNSLEMLESIKFVFDVEKPKRKTKKTTRKPKEPVVENNEEKTEEQ